MRKKKKRLTTPILANTGARADRKTKADAKLVGRAVRERWPIPAEKKPEIVARLTAVVARSGPEADSAAVQAARVLALMEGQNQTDHWNTDKNTRLDQGKTTDRVGIEPVIIERPV